MPELHYITDSYFSNTRDCVEQDGDVNVTYAFFVRVPSMFAPRLMLNWLHEYTKQTNTRLTLETEYKEGDLIPAGEPLFYITGSFLNLVECETLILQRVGPPFIAALNAYYSCCELPDTQFIAMGARHCAGWEMQEMMDYAASIGGRAAQEDKDARGFINSANHATAHFFGHDKGSGTMPHAMIGYYNSTLKAAKRYRAQHPDKPFIVLNDYFGKEIKDSLEVCRHFKKEAEEGILSFRLDTNGARYLEGLDYNTSIEVIRRNAPETLKMHFSERELKALYGQGVSAAAIWHFRNELDSAGFPNVKIVASSGFNYDKCRVMKLARAPIDFVGTGSFLPTYWQDTYATADILKFGNNYRIKEGRAYLIDRYKQALKEKKLRHIEIS